MNMATPLAEAAGLLGSEIMDLIEHGLSVGVGGSELREYLVAPLVLDGERTTGALLLSAGSLASHDYAHQVRNLLARLRSIAVHSAESAESVADYAAHLDGRISAAGRAQSSAALGPDAPTDLEGMVRDELLLQAARNDEDYTVEGPQVDIPSHVTEVLVLALHELATNAVKFGAFSQRNAFLTVSWRVDNRADDEPWLVLEWSEAGVTMAAAPHRQGFGTTLIRQRLPHELKGETSLEFRPGGVLATMAFPLRLAQPDTQRH
jgi:two-component sensor histidine kinase